MQILKELTFSDVNNGPISIGQITTNSPTLVKASVGIDSAFDELVTATLTFNPVAGTNTSVRRIISTAFAAGYAWDLDSSASVSDPEGLFIKGDGVLNIELDGVAIPTTGKAYLMVNVDSYQIK